MSPAAEPLIARLPPLSPRLARARDRILKTLSGLKAEIVEAAPAGPWVVFDTAAGRVALAQDEPARDHAEVLARLDLLEPLLAALEAGGLVLDPVDITETSDADIHVRVQAFDADVILALDIATAEAWPDPGKITPDLSTLSVPLPVVLTLDGPSVPANSALGVGDVVLLPLGADRDLAATIAVAGRHARGVFSPARGGFSVNSLEPIPMSDLALAATVDPAPDPSSVAGLADLPVTLRVALGEVTLTAAQLAGLRPGSTVTLDVPPGEARAILLAGDRPVAGGKLVALGQAYGLVIDKVVAEA